MYKKISLLSALAYMVFNINAASAQNMDPNGSYLKCMDGNTELSDDYTAKCLEKEVARIDGEINKLYEMFLKEQRFQKWNNGNGMFRGNMKDTNDSFAAYRNRFCSFYNLAMENYSISKEYSRQQCLVKVTEQYYQMLVVLSRDYDADME